MRNLFSLAKRPELNVFGTNIYIESNLNGWYRLIYFDEEDQHLEFFDETLKVVLSSDDLTLEDIFVAEPTYDPLTDDDTIKLTTKSE